MHHSHHHSDVIMPASYNCTTDEQEAFLMTSSPTNDTTEWDQAPDHALSTLYALASLLASLGNAAILVAFVFNRRLLDKSFNILVLNLTVADLAVGLLDLPWQVLLNETGDWPFDRVSCALLIYCDWGMTFVSIFTLVAISVDRYAAACWSTAYHQSKPQKRAWITVGFIWLFLLMTWTPAFVIDRVRQWSVVGNCEFDVQVNRAFSIYVVFAGYHLPSAFMVFAYVRVYVKLREMHNVVSPLSRHVPSDTLSGAVSGLPTYHDAPRQTPQPINVYFTKNNKPMGKVSEISEPNIKGDQETEIEGVKKNSSSQPMEDQISDHPVECQPITKLESNHPVDYQPITQHEGDHVQNTDMQLADENEPMTDVVKLDQDFWIIQASSAITADQESPSDHRQQIISSSLGKTSSLDTNNLEGTSEAPHDRTRSLDINNVEGTSEAPHTVEITVATESSTAISIEVDGFNGGLLLDEANVGGTSRVHASNVDNVNHFHNQNMHLESTSSHALFSTVVEASELFPDNTVKQDNKDLLFVLNGIEQVKISKLAQPDSVTPGSDLTVGLQKQTLKPETALGLQKELGKSEVYLAPSPQKNPETQIQKPPAGTREAQTAPGPQKPQVGGTREAVASARELRIFKSLTLILGAYLALWTPCQICVDLLCFYPSLDVDTFYSYSSALSYFNSALNPFLYAVGSAEMRASLRRALRRSVGRR